MDDKALSDPPFCTTVPLPPPLNVGGGVGLEIPTPSFNSSTSPANVVISAIPPLVMTADESTGTDPPDQFAPSSNGSWVAGAPIQSIAIAGLAMATTADA